MTPFSGLGFFLESFLQRVHASREALRKTSAALRSLTRLVAASTLRHVAPTVKFDVRVLEGESRRLRVLAYD